MVDRVASSIRSAPLATPSSWSQPNPNPTAPPPCGSRAARCHAAPPHARGLTQALRAFRDAGVEPLIYDMTLAYSGYTGEVRSDRGGRASSGFSVCCQS
jgi:hypothetical protein